MARMTIRSGRPGPGHIRRLVRQRKAGTLLATLGLLAVAACGGGESDGPSESAAPASRGATQVVEPTAAAGVSAPTMALASTDIGVGRNTVSFGLIDSQAGPLRQAGVRLSTFYLPPGAQQEGPVETVPATFVRWPAGSGGIYRASIVLDRPGDWGLLATVPRDGGSQVQISVKIRVGETTRTPAVGSPAPRSVNKTAADVARLEELTTDLDPDPGLYATTVADAIESGKPLLVVFATPAFCQTATCGPQLRVVKDLNEEYGDRMSFIHVEVYDNPHLIQGDLSNAEISPILAEWNLPSEPWVFVVDDRGLVSSKFEGFATVDELESALAGVLR